MSIFQLLSDILRIKIESLLLKNVFCILLHLLDVWLSLCRVIKVQRLTLERGKVTLWSPYIRHTTHLCMCGCGSLKNGGPAEQVLGPLLKGGLVTVKLKPGSIGDACSSCCAILPSALEIKAAFNWLTAPERSSQGQASWLLALN